MQNVHGSINHIQYCSMCWSRQRTMRDQQATVEEVEIVAYSQKSARMPAASWTGDCRLETGSTPT
eukprot:5550886-Pleurochrysis_carterae.AAC.1